MCGFEAFGEARSTSDQSFSLVALLFLLFFSGCGHGRVDERPACAHLWSILLSVGRLSG